jgi:autoinducer 2-degrading protein
MEIILVEVNVKPERLNDFLDLIKYDAEHSENDEPGCLRFDVLRDTEDEHKFFYYEVYKDADARAAHRETPHFKRYAAESADMFTGALNRRILTNQVPSDASWR